MPKRPPKVWFDKMRVRVRKQYPTYGKRRVNKIVGGIWQNYSQATKNKILRREGKMGKKYGKIGAPRSAKRKAWLRKIRRKR